MSFENLTGTTSNRFYIGNLATHDGYIYLYANTKSTNTPCLRYSNYSNNWELSNDGTTFAAIGGASGVTLPIPYTAGDILYASDTTTLSKRTIGTTGQVLTVAGGVPTWATTTGLIGATLTTDTKLGVSANLVNAYGTAIGASSSANTNSFSGGYSSGAGMYCVSVGYSAKATNASESVCIGNEAGNLSVGNRVVVIGSKTGNALAVGDYSTFVGAYSYPSTASTTYCVAIGYKAQPVGSNSIVIGTANANADLVGKGANTILIGNTSQTDGYITPNNLHIGTALAGDKYIYAENADTNKPYIRYNDTGNVWELSNNGTAVSAISSGAVLTGTTTTAITSLGTGNTTSGNNSTVLGYNITTGTFIDCVAIGTSATISNADSVTVGGGSRADYRCVAIGKNANNGSSQYSTTLGWGAGNQNNTTLGNYSVLIGSSAGNTCRSGIGSIHIGSNAIPNTDNTNYCIGIGYNSQTVGVNSIVISSGASAQNGKGANTILIGNTSQTDSYITPNKLHIGTGSSGDKYIYAENADTNKPYIRYNDTGNVWELSNDGAAVNAINTKSRSLNWWNCGVVPTTTAPSTSSVTIAGLTVKPGDPIRILEKSGVIFSTVTPKINSTAIVVSGNLLDYRGCLYFKSKTTTDPTFYYDIYSDELCTNLIGTTTTFIANVANTYTLTVSGSLTGTVSVSSIVEARSPNIIHRVAMMHTGVCTAYDATTLTFAGQAISTAASNILEVWLGNPTLVIQYPIDIAGSYATATTSTAFQDRQSRTPYWDQSNAILCMVKARNTTNDTGATQAKIAMVINGNPIVDDASALVLSTARVSTIVEMIANMQEINFGNSLEMKVVAGTNSNSQDLQGSAIFVLA